MKKNYDEKKLLEYGFIKNKHVYEYKHVLNNDLYAVYYVDDNIDVKVFEIDSDLEYLPYYMKNANGSYITTIKNEIEKIKKDIISKCFKTNNIVDDIKRYITKYDSYIEYPWEDTPLAFTMKCASNNKWFGICMNITYKKLGLSSDESIYIINLKLDPNHIDSLIDNESYFRAYHMNKKYWMTIALDYNLDIDKLYHLIDEAYNIVNKK